MEDITVSISCLTYNHAKFLRKCFDGFLMQETDFKFEVLIHDDASTDGTIEIIKEYQEKFPEIFKPIIQEVNQYSQGKRGFSAKYNFSRAKGRYIALCEGDDYWTNAHKLQKQVDFLEANLDYAMSFHDALVVHNNKQNLTETFSERYKFLRERSEFNHIDVVERWFMPTASLLFRKQLIDNYPSWASKVYSGDYTLQLLISQHGLIKYHDEIWCTHLKHDGGISQRKDLEAARLEQRIYQYKKYIQYFDKKHRYPFSLNLKHLYQSKLELEKNSYSKINTKLSSWFLDMKSKYLYYYQQYSKAELKNKFLNRFF